MLPFGVAMGVYKQSRTKQQLLSFSCKTDMSQKEMKAYDQGKMHNQKYLETMQ